MQQKHAIAERMMAAATRRQQLASRGGEAAAAVAAEHGVSVTQQLVDGLVEAAVSDALLRISGRRVPAPPGDGGGGGGGRHLHRLRQLSAAQREGARCLWRICGLSESTPQPAAAI
jgi:hypothetical protein